MLFVNTAAPFSLHMQPLLFAVSSKGTLLRAIELSAVYGKLIAAHRAKGCFMSFAAKCGFQNYIVWQHRLPKVPAQGPCPALCKHIALIVHGQTAIARIVVCTKGCYKLSDSCPLRAAQLPDYFFSHSSNHLEKSSSSITGCS